MREDGAVEVEEGWRMGLEAQHETVCASWWLSQEREVIRDEGDLLPQLGRQQPERVVGRAVEQGGWEHEVVEEQQDLVAPSHWLQLGDGGLRPASDRAG